MYDFRRPEASEHYERAMALERVGRIDEALAEYRRAVDVDPGFAEAYEALGYHYQRRGLLMKSLDAFQTLARLEGHYAAYFNMGYILVELERYEDALEAFQQCLTLAPDDPSALYEIGYIHYILGNLPQALESLYVPQDVYGDDWRVHNLIGACHLRLEAWEEAEASYRQALLLAASTEEAEEAQAGLWVARRYQEFDSGSPLGFKERVYADGGVVVLGTAGDDGLEVPSREELVLSPAAIAVTLRRLQALVESFGLGLTAVVAVDRASIPLAAALGRMQGVTRKRLSQLESGDRPLLVLLAGRRSELLQVALEQAPKGTLSFVYALGWYGKQILLPDFIGVSVRGEVISPRGDPPRDEAEIQASAEALLAAFAEVPVESNGEAQIRYYVEERRHLRFRAVGAFTSTAESGRMD